MKKLMGSTAVEDYRACLEGVALLGERDLDGAVAVLEPLVDTEDCPCRVEAAFLLGVVRLAQALPDGMRRHAAADAFAVAAAGGNPVYPFFVHNDFEQREQLASLWRYQLLDNLNPVMVLRATHALAQFDGVTETPSLQTLLRDYLET